MNGQFRAPLLGLLVLVIAAAAPGQTAAPPATTAQPSAPPPVSRPPTGDDEERAKQLVEQINKAMKEDHWDEAISRAEDLLSSRTRARGAGHFETIDAAWRGKTLRRLAALPGDDRAAFISSLDMNLRATELYRSGNFASAQPLFEKALEIQRRLLGEDYPETARSYNNLAVDLEAQGKDGAAQPLKEKALEIRRLLLGEDHPDTAVSYNNAAMNRMYQGRFDAAQPLLERALEIRRRLLGDGLDTAQSYSNLATNLDYQGKHAVAQPLFEKALEIHRRLLPEDHPDSAFVYDRLATNLASQGKFAAAQSLFDTALGIRRRLLTDDHPDIATSYTNAAINLTDQGRYAGAEPLLRKALTIDLKALGEGHPDTASTYNSLASNLDAQGKYAEAEPLFRKALAIRLQAHREGHPDTASTYNNLATNLRWQGKYAEAESLCRKALAIQLQAHGEDHPRTAAGYNNLALNLDHQGKHAEAEPLLRQALAIDLKALGEGHPETAHCYSNLAVNLKYQGRYAEAEPLLRQALAIDLKALGEGHPDTALTYNHLAINLDAQGKLDDAVVNWAAAAAIYERTRGARAASGWERSLASESSPLPALAVALARRGEPREAWDRWETDLARGLLDDLSARLLRPLTSDQRSREADLAGQLQRLDERITRLAAKARRTEDEDRQLNELRGQHSGLRGQWVEFQNTLDREYQAYAGKPATLEAVQKALPTDAALVGWLDVNKHHWACVVRHQGDPIWVQIPGSGQDGAWTKEDEEGPRKLRGALADPQLTWRTAAEALARRRLAPLLPHLKGVKHLIILPSWALTRVPIEALVASGPDAGLPSLVVSYAPSGSMLARLTAPRSPALVPPRLLALGDPAFPKPASSGPAPAPPDHGIAILAVVAYGTADLFGLKPGDVFLEYNGKVLKTMSDLAVVPAGDKPTRVPVKLWRDGEIRSLEIAAGPLGIQSHPDRPAAQVVLARRAAAEVLTPGVHGEYLTSLPGTRREVQAIAALFPSDRVTTLLGADATESNLQRLATSGALKSYRFLHLAAHGKANPDVALSSALFLAAEPERPTSSADPAAPESAPDGRVTAEQIVRTWDLGADLVVLSACESGLGRYAGGEGYLGFAQALFVKGARTLVLSLWKVDDRATSLLMTRFYQNLLGRRPGLADPLPKAEALDEAKAWLRELTAGEIDGELAQLTRGDPAAPRKSPLVKRPGVVPASSLRRYQHPYFWAGFILVGDPD
jgi:tetratricopeptide (TPR) repeat protein